MPVPSSISDLSSTASSNYPSGSESIGTSLDDYLRAHASIIKQVSDAYIAADASLTSSISAKQDASTAVTLTGTQTLQNKTLDSTCNVSSAAGVSVPAGTIIDFAGTSAPSGFLACPLVPTNISRTTYSALFSAIGTTWGAGDGSTTFGMPYFPADYVGGQANGNVGTTTVGQNLAHTHAVDSYVSGALGSSGRPQEGTSGSTDSFNTLNSGGSANLAASVRILKCVKI